MQLIPLYTLTQLLLSIHQRHTCYPKDETHPYFAPSYRLTSQNAALKVEMPITSRLIEDAEVEQVCSRRATHLCEEK